jgi:type I restriction enzyme M protein
MPSNNSEIEKKLWDAADELRANSKLRSSEYSTPVLGLVFLKWADHKFSVIEKELEKKGRGGKRRREVGKADYQARGVMYLPTESRFLYLMRLPEKSDIGKAINDAMKAIEDENKDLRGVLPTTYHRFDNRVLFSLLRIFNSIPMDVKGDVFGKVYEYFLGKFAMAEGQRGGEFFTPTSIVRLIVEIIEPFHGRIYDPACGSGGMFVQSARFVQEHKKNPSEEISVYGQENKTATVQLCKMNLAVHGLSGDIREGNTYYEDIHESSGKFDFVMANPPFNVDRVDKNRIKDDPRFSFGIPTVDNANYLWIQIFYNSLSNEGQAGFVMANSAGIIGGSELEIRKEMLGTKSLDVIIEIGSRFFYTVTLPCTLWFFDKRKTGTERKNKVLFISAKSIYTQVDRAHREFTSSQIRFISNIVRMFRKERIQKHDSQKDNEDLPEWVELFPDDEYHDIPGLCKVLTLEEIESHKFSLHPSRHVGIPEGGSAETNAAELLLEFRKELTNLIKESNRLIIDVLRTLDHITEG